MTLHTGKKFNRKKVGSMIHINEDIKKLRADIDKLDHELLKILRQRINITEKIGKIKKTSQSDIIDKHRESKILSSLLTAGKNMGISENFIISIWRQIIDYSHKVQEECE
jgi:chorismate mutase